MIKKPSNNCLKCLHVPSYLNSCLLVTLIDIWQYHDHGETEKELFMLGACIHMLQPDMPILNKTNIRFRC